MDSLQIGLIVIGAVIVLGIYLWSKFEKPAPQTAPRKEPTLTRETAPSEPEPAMDFDDAVSRDITFDELPATLEVEPELEPEPEVAAPLMVLLHVLGDRNHPFRGEALVKAANHAGLQYGEMKIFHFQQDDVGIRFSMANMLEPGYFELERIESFSTPGLILFMDASQQQNLALALDTLLHAAQSLSKALGGSLCDGDRQPLDDEASVLWKASLIAKTR